MAPGRNSNASLVEGWTSLMNKLKNKCNGMGAIQPEIHRTGPAPKGRNRAALGAEFGRAAIHAHSSQTVFHSTISHHYVQRVHRLVGAACDADNLGEAFQRNDVIKSRGRADQDGAAHALLQFGRRAVGHSPLIGNAQDPIVIVEHIKPIRCAYCENIEKIEFRRKNLPEVTFLDLPALPHAASKTRLSDVA